MRTSFPGLSRKGAALIVVMTVMVSLAVITAAYIAMVTSATRTVGGEEDNLKAFYTAEAGLNKAVWYLLNTAPNGTTDGSWRTQAYPTPSGVNMTGNPTSPKQESFGNGQYTQWVETSGGQIQITAVGVVNGVTRRVRQSVQISQSSVFMYAAYAQGSITLSNNALVDSYNSALGNYGGANVGSAGQVGTNGTGVNVVSLGNNATVQGTVSTGAGGTVSVGNNAVISGGQTHTNNVALPSITVPAGLLTAGPGGTLSVANNATVSLAAGLYRYASINMANNATLRITGNVTIYVTGNPGLTLGNNTEWIVDSGASLKIYADGVLNFANNVVINDVTRKPENFVIYSTYTGANGVTINNNGIFYGVIYAPDTNVILGNNVSVYGAVIGETVTMSNNSQIHYDTALISYVDPGSSLPGGTVGISAVAGTWREL